MQVSFTSYPFTKNGKKVARGAKKIAQRVIDIEAKKSKPALGLMTSNADSSLLKMPQVHGYKNSNIPEKYRSYEKLVMVDHPPKGQKLNNKTNFSNWNQEIIGL